MTLKEKLMKESWDYEFPISNLQADNIIKKADDYAIEFAEWVNINYFVYNTWEESKSIKELLEIFKKEKVL